jgi:hypothetical protein
MTITQAEYLITHLMMRANAHGQLPMAVKATAHDVGDWPPAEGEPTSMTNGASIALTDVCFYCPGGNARFRIKLEPIT